MKQKQQNNIMQQQKLDNDYNNKNNYVNNDHNNNDHNNNDHNNNNNKNKNNKNDYNNYRTPINYNDDDDN